MVKTVSTIPFSFQTFACVSIKPNDINFVNFLIDSRSRSVTPSSHPGTPPQHQQNDMLSASNFSTNLANSLTSAQMKPEYATARTYSDQLRNFAAKYNALNEYVKLFVKNAKMMIRQFEPFCD